MSSFPSSIPSYAGFTSTETLAAAQHASQHNAEQGDIVALATKLGTGSATAGNNTVLRGNGTGTTDFDQVHLATDVSGTLPVTSGGTGVTTSTGTGNTVLSSSPTIATPTISDPTITGGGSWAGSPSIVAPTLTGQPTITDFTNADHNHTNAAGGGTLGASAITGVNSSVLYNPYKFSVYQNSSQTLTSTTSTKITFDTKEFDTGTNYDATTNHRFIASVAGFYLFTGSVSSGAQNGNTGAIISIYKNGSEFKRGTAIEQGNNAGGLNLSVTAMLSLAVNDYVEVYWYNGDSVSRSSNTGGNQTYFQGLLVSTT